MNPDLAPQGALVISARAVFVILGVGFSPVGLSLKERERNVNIGKVGVGFFEKILCKWQKKIYVN